MAEEQDLDAMNMQVHLHIAGHEPEGSLMYQQTLLRKFTKTISQTLDESIRSGEKTSTHHTRPFLELE